MSTTLSTKECFNKKTSTFVFFYRVVQKKLHKV